MIGEKRNTKPGIHSLLLEDTSRYDFWLKLVMVGVPALMFIGGMALIFEDMAGALTMFGTTAFIILLFKVIMPRRFQILDDRLRIVLGKPFALNIPFSSIKSVRKVSGIKALASSGIRFATSSRYVVEISRKKGLAVTFSPARGELFLEQLSRAMEQHQARGTAPIH